MLTILSHSTNPATLEWWKYHLRRLLRIERGPDAVRQSLFRGLPELDVPYRHNHRPLSDTVLVLSGVEALKEAIKAKKSGQVKRLIAGPNITVHPHDHDRLMCDVNIDVVLTPSDWTKDYWSKAAPEIAQKIKAWPAGVAMAPASNRCGRPILYDKLKDDVLLEQVKNALAVEVTVFTYGKFSRSDYLAALCNAPYLIYLSESESQGLALQEAWAHDVPTAVIDRQEWRNGNLSWRAPQINAPYLNDEMGVVFKSPTELLEAISHLRSVHPRPYCDRELSDRASASKLLEII